MSSHSFVIVVFVGKSQYLNNVIATNRNIHETKAPITFNIVQMNANSPQFLLTERPPISAFTPAGVPIMIITVRFF